MSSAVAAAAAGEFQVMGIVNVTPDSFSDGGRYLDRAAAIAHGLELERAGASILDIGGESTRPGAHPVAEAEELRRVIPVIEGLQAQGSAAQISIDTSKAAVADAALQAGATLVNDVTALRGDPAMAEVVAGAGADLCLMHMLGDPRTMQRDPHYDDVISEVRAFLQERLSAATAAGIAPARIALDPGIGFGKTTEHNLALLRRVGELVEIGRPVLIGTSRKSFLGKITARPVEDRIAATIATNLFAYERGARIFRVHDAAPIHDALQVMAATVQPPWLTTPTSSTMSTT